jgi:hypothetical protein
MPYTKPRLNPCSPENDQDRARKFVRIKHVKGGLLRTGQTRFQCN